MLANLFLSNPFLSPLISSVPLPSVPLRSILTGKFNSLIKDKKILLKQSYILLT
jgi:hypothetical protein